MKKHLIIIALLIIMPFILTSCFTYSPPDKLGVVNTKTIYKNYEDTWKLVFQWLAANSFPIATMDKPSGLITTVNNIIDYDANWCDCGDPGLGRRFTNRRGYLNIILEKIDEGKTSVRINIFVKDKLATKVSDSNYTYDEVPCVSTGVLEKNLFDYIGR